METLRASVAVVQSGGKRGEVGQKQRCVRFLQWIFILVVFVIVFGGFKRKTFGGFLRKAIGISC